jgi:hypothetical protein
MSHLPWIQFDRVSRCTLHYVDVEKERKRRKNKNNKGFSLQYSTALLPGIGLLNTFELEPDGNLSQLADEYLMEFSN